MGKKIEIKLIVIIGLLIVTCIFVYGYNQPAAVKDKPPLSGYFAQVNGYETLDLLSMSDDHIRMLDLDDYVFANYRGAQGKINLYVGYYYAANKAYAAHSPTVCYPSQGWRIDSDPVAQTMKVGPYKITFEEITTSFGREKELVLYWYQARLHSNIQVYKNKISMGYNKLFKNDEQHAFVRVSVPMANSTYEASKATATEFIRAFYPRFIDFITADAADQ